MDEPKVNKGDRAQPKLDESRAEEKSDRVQPEPSTHISDQYCTSLYNQLGIPTCRTCGEKKRTVEGQQICPAAKPNCSFLKHAI